MKKNNFIEDDDFNEIFMTHLNKKNKRKKNYELKNRKNNSRRVTRTQKRDSHEEQFDYYGENDEL